MSVNKKSYHIRLCGVGRSGSTVIGAFLAGRIEGATHVGEVIRFSKKSGRVSRSTWFCSCGRPVKQCKFWKQVDVIHQQDTEYSQVLGQVTKLSGVIVDTSKTFPETVHADLDLHLVKDPRATTWSWFRRRKVRTDAGGVETLRQIRILELPRHILYEYKWFLKFRLKGICVLRYEKFVESPEAYLYTICNILGVAPRDEYDGDSNHGVGGNVARHNFDGLMINEQGWRTEAPRWLRATLALAYAPLLLYLNLPLQNELRPAW